MTYTLPSDEELRARLTAEEYNIMREKGAEDPYTGDYLLPGPAGIYACKLCGNDLFASNAQFNSMMGWPAFDMALQGAVEARVDTTPGVKRSEVVCAECKSHLGYLSEDGHTENKAHYCINGAVLKLDETKTPPPRAPHVPLPDDTDPIVPA